MADGRMTFGRHRGIPIELVPVEYLAWVVERTPNPPQSVLAEVQRRAERVESHDGLIAQSALSNRLFKRPKKGRPSLRARWYAKAAAVGKGHRGRKGW